MKLSHIAFALLFVGSSVTAHAEKMRVSTGIQVKEYNNVASDYYDRPTFAHIKTKKKSDYLTIEVDFIHKAENSFYDKEPIWFEEEHVDEYVAAIDKYLQWEEMASKDGDMFTKEIEQVKTRKGFKVKFTFHSGNAQTHYLSLSMCLMACVEPNFIFDVENAQRLKDTLLKMKEGTLNATTKEEINDKYK